MTDTFEDYKQDVKICDKFRQTLFYSLFDINILDLLKAEIYLNSRP